MRNILVLFAVLIFIGCKEETPEVKKPKTALQLLNESIEKDPNNKDLFIDRAKNYLSHKDYQSAEADANKALALDSTATEAYLLLANLYFEQNKTANTNAYLNQLLKVDSMHIDGNLKKAELELYVGNYQETIRLVNRVLRQEITNEKGYYMKAMAFKLAGDTTLAISNFQTTVEQDPDHYNAFVQLVLLFMAKKDPLCLNYFDNALAIKPNSPEVLYAVGMYFQESGDTEKAKEVYNQLLSVNAGHTDSYYNLGYIALNYDKDYPTARSHFQEGLKFLPEDSRFKYMEGLTYELEGETEKANAIYNSILLKNAGFGLAKDGYNRTK